MYVLYDPSTYPLSSALTIWSKRHGVVTELCWGQFRLRLEEVGAVWYRRPSEFRLPARLLPKEQNWLRMECNHVFRSVWANLNALWVNEPRRNAEASLKIHQLATAGRIGFEIPRFVVTNDVREAEAFVRSVPGQVVAKVLAEPYVTYGDSVRLLYTHLLSQKDVDQLESVRFGPTFLQEFVTKAMDVRVTVIGTAVFAVGIMSRHDPVGRIDFRRANIFELPHEKVTLPKKVEAACRQLVRAFGLRFGAIDLLLTPDGKYFFLEINPNGQWYWLELAAGVPLTKALCDLLARPLVGVRRRTRSVKKTR